MNEKLSEALDHISDRHIAEAAGALRKRRPHWLGAAAAVLALVILVTSLSGPATVQAQGLVAGPEYPEMAPYPSYEGDGYAEWNTSRRAQYDQPTGYGDSLNGFFLRSIPEFLKTEAAENAVCSPLNITMALAMLAETTGGESRQQILELLGARSMKALRTQAGYVWNAHYCADGATSTVLANSLWLDSGIQYNMDTVQTLADSYYASVYQGKLGSEEMNAALQRWLDEQTGGLLKEQAQNVELPPQTVLALASTVFYQAKWVGEFQEENNTEGLFHAPGGDVEVIYMNRTQVYGPYFWGEDYAAVYLELEDGSRMWLILPDEGTTPAELLESGHALDMLLGTPDSYENQKGIRVNLSLPKFDIVSDRDLREDLMALGLTDVFDSGAADFSAIMPEDEAYLNKVQHAARVAIDEVGVTAAAYTVMAMCGAGAPPQDEVDLILDRPFLFVITSRDNLPLFAGVVNAP